MKTTFIAVALFGLVATAYACPANEGVAPCKRLDEECKFKNSPITTLICIANSDCTCLPEFYRNSTGACVTRDQCDDEKATMLSCPAGETMVGCHRFNEACESRNKRFLPHVCIKPTKCECQPGLFRNAQGKCVPAFECEDNRDKREVSNNCPPNERVPVCLRRDEDCKDKDAFTIGVCTPTNECQCKPGFNRNSKNVCVRKDQCDDDVRAKREVSNNCPPNERVPICLRRDEDCKDKDAFTIAVCTPTNECQCKPGFNRNSKKVCVRKEQCDDSARAKRAARVSTTPRRSVKTTPRRSHPTSPRRAFSPRPRLSVPTTPRRAVPRSSVMCRPDQYMPGCKRLNEQCKDRNMRVFMMICIPNHQCQCRTGLFRNQAGNCVRKEECEEERAASTTAAPKACPRNEYIPPCMRCDEDCKNKDLMCARICIRTNKCTCVQGYNRNRFGSCVPKALCDMEM